MTDPIPLPPLDIPALLRQAGITPSRGLGQNFIADDRVLAKIAAAADISLNDTVLEIGPGLGSLTRHLAQSARQVTAVELDRKLFPLLEQTLAQYPNITLVSGDILETRLNDLNLPAGYLVVANIPYYITSAVIRHLLESEIRPARIVLTVQQEVAQRICAAAGDMNLLALSVQVYGAPRVMTRIPAGAFYPAPKVDSAVVRIDLYPRPLIAEDNLDRFFQLCKAGFSQKRKTLRNSLSSGLRISPAQVESLLAGSKIDAGRRAETLSLDEWGRLVTAWK
jgi:16S rRNA (adenine1518-N6/adenine1519-N6)-dimethyltransferase